MSSALEGQSALEVALRVAAAFDALGCEYFLGGSLASSLHGEPRATNDIDFVVAMMPHRVRAFAEKLGPDFEVDQDMLRDALLRGHRMTRLSPGDRRDGAGERPAAALRGGDWNNGPGSGAFALNLNNGPSNWNSNVGFRCAVPGRAKRAVPGPIDGAYGPRRSALFLQSP